jgi:hypothetical protein
MSRFRNLSPRARAAWTYGLIAVFLLMCALIAAGQWYAIHVNVPRYERLQQANDRR